MLENIKSIWFWFEVWILLVYFKSIVRKKYGYGKIIKERYKFKIFVWSLDFISGF